MTTVGYGDILPKSDPERWYATLIMLLGATVFGYIVGSVATVANDPNGVHAMTNRRLTNISNYLIEQDIAKPIRDHTRRSLVYFFERKTPFREAALLDLLPAHLRRQIIMDSNSDVLQHIPIFRMERESTIAYVLQHMRPSYSAQTSASTTTRQGPTASTSSSTAPSTASTTPREN